MPDREKVISHFQDAITASGAGNRWRFVRADIIEDAIALLREQEPVKPRYDDSFGNRSARCGYCNAYIVGCYKYCPGCGKRVKWDA